jgi:ferredoxin
VVEVELKSQTGEILIFPVEGGTGESLLDLIEAAGGRSPFGCRVGTCGTCVVRVHEGLELLDAPRMMEEDTLERVPAEKNIALRLACRASVKLGAQGRLVIEKVRIR